MILQTLYSVTRQSPVTGLTPPVSHQDRMDQARALIGWYDPPLPSLVTLPCPERASRLSRRRSLMRGPQHRAAGEIYIQVSNIYQEGGEEVKALEYLETALDYFVRAGEKVIAARISEDVLRLTLCQDYSDSDVIEKVTIIFKHARQLFAIFCPQLFSTGVTESEIVLRKKHEEGLKCSHCTGYL